MQDNKKSLIYYGIISVIAISVFTVGLLIYNRYITEVIAHASHITLEESVNQQAFVYVSKIEGEMHAIRLLAKSITEDPSYISSEMIAKISESSPYDDLGLADENGKAVYSNGITVNVSERDYYRRAMNGETCISHPINSKERQAEVIVISTPIIHNGEIKGALIGSYFVSEFDKLLPSSFSSEGYAYVAAADGKIISESLNAYSLRESDNIFDTFKESVFFDLEDFSLVLEKLQKQEPGHFKYMYKDNSRVAHYVPLQINGWTLFSIVPEEVIFGNAQKITMATGLLSLVVCGVFIVLIIWIFKMREANLEKLSQIAFVDDLTKAPTLAKFKIEAQKFIDENPDKQLLMVKFDVDKFKLINRTLGFEAGDMVIKNLAIALKMDTPGKFERYARVHIDEFIVMYEYENEEQLIKKRNAYNEIFRDLMGRDFAYKVKIISGCYYMKLENCKDVSEAIEKANIAHRKAKKIGSEICIYDESFINEALRKSEIENKMWRALAIGDFKVFLQPKYELEKESMVGAEALVRWSDNGKLIFPMEFIPFFEENGFIIKLDMYMFESVCRIIRKWIDSGLDPIKVSVNFSRNHLSDPKFVNNLCLLADKYQVPHELLEVELTESTIFDNEQILLDVLAQLHQNGFTLSMDDFGAGYSSLGLLKNIPVDTIKIDRSFFEFSSDNDREEKIIANIIRMASELNINTVAEGVETKEHIQLLRKLKCDIVQSYYYSRPVPVSELTDTLIARKKEKNNN